MKPCVSHFSSKKHRTGWWFFATPLKNDGVKVSWDHEIPNIIWKNNQNVPNHQPDSYPFQLVVVMPPSLHRRSLGSAPWLIDDDDDDDDGDDGVHQERPCGDKDLDEQTTVPLKHWIYQDLTATQIVPCSQHFSLCRDPAIAGGPWRCQVQRWRSHFVWWQNLQIRRPLVDLQS